MTVMTKKMPNGNLSPNWFIEFEVSHNGARKVVRKTSGIEISKPLPPRDSAAFTVKVWEKWVCYKQAEKLEAQWKTDALEYIKSGRTQMTLGEAVERYYNTVTKLGRTDGKAYRKIMKRVLNHFGADTLLDGITQKALVDWRDGMLQGGKHMTKIGGKRGETVARKDLALKPRSVNTYLVMLLSVLNKAVEWSTLKSAPDCPMVKVNKKRTPRFLTPAEAQALLQAAAHDPSDPNSPPPHLQPLLRFLIATGARKGEALSLVWDNVKLSSNTTPFVHFEKSHEDAEEGTKNGGQRSVPFGVDIRDMLIDLKRWQREAGYKGDRVFVYKNTHGEWTELVGVGSSLATAARKARLKKCGLHTMRHTFASWLVQDGTPIKDVQVLMGHASVQTTEIYADLAPVPDHFQASVSRMEKRMAQLQLAA